MRREGRARIDPSGNRALETLDSVRIFHNGTYWWGDSCDCRPASLWTGQKLPGRGMYIAHSSFWNFRMDCERQLEYVAIPPNKTTEDKPTERRVNAELAEQSQLYVPNQ